MLYYFPARDDLQLAARAVAPRVEQIDERQQQHAAGLEAPGEMAQLFTGLPSVNTTRAATCACMEGEIEDGALVLSPAAHCNHDREGGSVTSAHVAAPTPTTHWRGM